MGNQQSSSQHDKHPPPQHQHHAPPQPFPQHAARRRESIPALSAAKAQAAPPSASLHHAESHHPTSTRPHSRGRSQTIGSTTTTAVANQLRAAQDSYKSQSSDAMGNEQSSQKGNSSSNTNNTNRSSSKEKSQGHVPHDTTPPNPQSTTTTTNTTPPPEKARQQLSPSSQQQQPLVQPSPQTQPVDVPIAMRDGPPPGSADQVASSIDPADASQHDYVVPASHFSRPPRLPLPIEEEFHRPGSPIVAGQEDISSPIDHDELEGILPRHTSMLSDKTADDDELDDEFKGPHSDRPTVPTLIEWEGPGERVYVTGSFSGWDRKYRLHRNGPSKKKDALSAYVHIAPGTHHLMFLVDNEMQTSDKLPTAVDYTNILVNYLEVSPDDVTQPAAPVTAQTEEQKHDATPVQDREKPPGVYPPQVLPATPELQPMRAPAPEPAKPKVPEPTKRYHQKIPRYLLDLDADEDDPRSARAINTTNSLPQPPTLPGFLAKSILNQNTPHKDDSSVLVMPNHTVLNHLATSSIRDNILATSATTRYKQKFLTTIMYKPKEEAPARSSY